MVKKAIKNTDKNKSTNLKKNTNLQFEKSLEYVAPEITKEWNYEKNGELTPNKVESNSSKKVWWKCDSGHEWQARINRRKSGTNCPYCSNQKILAGFNDLATVNPELASEWNYEKNGNLKPSDFFAGSGEKVWWKCSKCCYEWEATILSRNRGNGCPLCGKIKSVESREKNSIEKNGSFAECHPELLDSWDYKKNDISPFDATKSSSKKVWWKCDKGHSYYTSINNRINGRGCPFCSNRKVLYGYNDLSSTFPEIALEWNYERNGELRPENFVYGSYEKVWWKCSKCGYEWQAKISSRTQGHGCKKCGNKKTGESVHNRRIKKSGLFVERFPELICEWNFEKNIDININDISAFDSSHNVWWKCDKGHEWQTKVYNRTKTKTGCPYCSGRNAIKGVNDLQTTNPKIAAEWNYEKNGDLNPTDVLGNSNLKVWWKCSKCGHEWEAFVYHRNKGSTCPKCKQYTHTSFPEQAIYYYVKKLFPDAINSYKIMNTELDIFIPTIMYAIEYDGVNWHKDKAHKEARKNIYCQNNGIKLLRVREFGLPTSDGCFHNIMMAKNANLDTVIEQLLAFICNADVKIEIDSKKDSDKIYGQYLQKVYDNSIAVTNPEILKYWNYEKNLIIKPENVPKNSQKMIWWICHNCGNEWYDTASNMITHKVCSKCENQKVYKNKCISGVNDLLTINPQLSDEWHPTKNGELTPSDISANSKESVWWLGKCGHEWEAPVYLRNHAKKHLCPICSNRKVLIGFNDLGSVNPELAKEWHPTRNGNLTPFDITYGSSKKVWWKCSNCGNEWEKSVYERNKGSGCAKCSYDKAAKKKEINSIIKDGTFDDVYPELSKEWHPTKNGSVNPSNISYHYSKKVWWICKFGHEWEATISHRIKGENCPICSNRVILSGFNDLATLNPELALEWNYEKNGDLTPNKVGAGSSKKVWWKCSKCGHEWQTGINNRKSGTKCPVCAKIRPTGYRVKTGVNDLLTVNPNLAKDWHPTKNGDLTPTTVTFSSNKQIWWKCSKCGYEWQNSINNRNNGRGCPNCSKAKRGQKNKVAVR